MTLKKFILYVLGTTLFVIFLVLSHNTENTSQTQDNLSQEKTLISAKVVEVIDGDTLRVSINNTSSLVRMIGINAPESDGPYREIECYGSEAAQDLEQLLPAGSTVILETDPSQDTYDKYDRLLAYVFLDKVNINEQLIKQGSAHEYTYRTAYRYQTEFKRAEKEARENQLGLWGVCE